MTIKEFEEKLKADPKLQEKFDEAKKALDVKGNSKLYEALSKLASDMGFDVPESEFKLKKISGEELSEDELEAVAGGAYTECEADFTDTDCALNDYCDGWFNKYVLNKCRYTYIAESCGWNDACYVFHVDYECSGNYGNT